MSTTIDPAQDYHDARALCLADGEHPPSLALAGMVRRLIEQRDRARKGQAELRDALSVAIPGAAPAEAPEPAGRPVAGETVADKLSILAAWLSEDSDLPAGEVDDFVGAINAALELLPQEA